MSNPTTPFNWQMPTNTDLVTDLPADFEVFGQAVATSMADLLGGTSGQILSKATNADMDFTWVSANPGDITGVTAGTGISGGGTSGDVTITNSMATAIDAKGDLIAGTGADAFSRLGVGTNNQVLTADSTTATGLKWATPAAGSTFVGCSLYRTADLSVANSTATAIPWTAEFYDTNAFHDNSTNNSNLYPFYGGITGCLTWSIIFPIDTVKTEYQTTKNITVKNIIVNRFQKYGIKSFYSGIIPVYLRTFPSAFCGMYVYEKSRKLLNYT
jgi:hypothetical protein